MRLEHVLHDGHALGAVEVGGLAHQDFHMFVGNVVEALAAVNGGGGSGGALQLGDLHALAQGIHDVLGGQLRAQDIVRGDLAVDVHAVDGAVDGDNLHALGHGGLHRAGDAVGVHGVDDEDADVGGDQIFDVADLLGHVITGVGHAQLHAQFTGRGLGALHQGDKEGVVLGGDGEADGAVGCGGSGGGRLAVNDNGAARGKDRQGKAQKQCNDFFHVSNSYPRYRLLSERTATRMTTALMTS